AVAIAVIIDPRQASLGNLEMPLQQRFVAGCPPGGMERDQVERRGVSRAVVRRVRDQSEVSEFAVPDLVQDLARLCVAIVVLFLRLERTQDLERATGEIWIDQQVLE